MNISLKIISLVICWYLLIVSFYVGNFIGYELPEVENIFHYFIVIPYFGFGALVWAIFQGIGTFTIVLGLIFSYFFFKQQKLVFFVSHLIVGALGGVIFRFIST